MPHSQCDRGGNRSLPTSGSMAVQHSGVSGCPGSLPRQTGLRVLTSRVRLLRTTGRGALSVSSLSVGRYGHGP